MRTRLALLLLLGVLAASTIARAQGSRLAPIPKSEAVSTHGPYEMGACETCHQRHDASNPGAALKVSNDLCFECHDEFNGKMPVKMERAIHPTTKADCTACHNPHNAKRKKLRM